MTVVGEQKMKLLRLLIPESSPGLVDRLTMSGLTKLVCALVGGAYLSPPGPVVSPRWTPVFGCCSSTFSHQLFCTLTTQGDAMIRPWRQELPRGPAVGASWKLKAGPCQEACLSLVREERDGP